MTAHEISDEDSNATPVCGSVVLIINQNTKQPHRWVAISALVDAEG
jgi:hypothetical protein